MYAALSDPSGLSLIDWKNVHVFFTDERCVPPDDESSNYRMVTQALLDHVSIPADHIHRMKGELPPNDAADDYEQRLRECVSEPDGKFDFVLLGLGADGHTASLFPNTEALNATERWCVANAVPALDTHRLTLTYPILNSARRLVFLVTGSSKSAALCEVLSPTPCVALLPAQRIIPHTGQLLWVVDADACPDACPDIRAD